MNTKSPQDALDWLRKLGRISPVAIFRCDPQGACTYVNERWSEMTGLSRDVALGSGWEVAIHPEDRERIRVEWYRSAKERVPFRADYRYLKPEGVTVWAHCDAMEEFDDSGNLLGTIGCVMDVTELHRTREELQRARDELEKRVEKSTQHGREMALIIDQTDDAVIQSDLAGRIVGWNKGAEKLFGYSRAEVIGGSTLALTPPEEHGTALDIKRRVRLGEPIQHQEVVRVARDGRRIPVLLSVFPLRNEAGSIIGTAAIVRDLTAQKKAESRSRQLAQRLLSAQDEERRRIARELHDSTAQLLVALSINLNRLCMDDANLAQDVRAQLLAESCLLAERAMLDVRTQSYLLHPPLLEERGLAAALRFFIDGFIERSGITVEFHVPKHFTRLEPLVELTLFRIVQEALANVHRHSQSLRAEIALRVERGSIELTVRDFGRGLPSEPGELNGVGIAGMRERVAQLGGGFELESAEPGVKLCVNLPATHPHDHAHSSRR